MNKIKLLGLSILLSVFAISIKAQERKIASANKLYDKYAYINAIKTYERVAEKGHKSADLFQKLGNAYYFNSELDKSAKWYGELFALNQTVEPEYYYRYAQSLKSIGEYDKANEMLNMFAKSSGADIRAKLYAENRDYLEVIKKNSGRYEVKTTNINSKYSDYGPSFLGDKLVFTSSRDTVGFSRKIDRWTNQSFTTLYVADINGDNLGEPLKFSRKINSKFHESTPVFTKDGKTMYFTRNNFNKGKTQRDKDRTILLKVYRATLEDGKWTNIRELSFNSNAYSVAHPALSTDEKTLYFASDMPGTIGESDIFKVKINKNGSFGTPENLGKGINTEGRETFPFISKNNELYFASDGHLGLGGLDIFMSKPEGSGAYIKVKNVGSPVNGPQDDFALIINTDSKKGFFSSNREGGSGYDDIYSFIENNELEFDCEHLLAGIITDFETGEIIANAKITLFDADFKQLKVMNADGKGLYSFEVECGKLYYVRAEKEKYATKEVNIVIPELSGKTDLPITLDKIIKKVGVGDDLAVTFGIEIIYFDLDKSNIRPYAALDLEKVIDVMKQYPTMKVDVRSHTDSRASHKYNEKLSDRRAKSTIEYMVKNGIDRNRLTGRGYGETQLVNKCKDGINCTEEEHQKNRRSQFIIMEL